MLLVMGVEGGLVAGCTEPGLPEVGLKSGILKVLGDSCGCERGNIGRVPWNP